MQQEGGKAGFAGIQDPCAIHSQATHAPPPPHTQDPGD